MREENRKKAYMPYKVATTLLYGEREFLRRTGDGTIVATTGPFALAMRVTNGALLEALAHLQELGVISTLTVLHGSVIINVAPPVGFIPATIIVPTPEAPSATHPERDGV